MFIHQYMKVMCACAAQPFDRKTCGPHSVKSTSFKTGLKGSPVSFWKIVGKAPGIQYGSLSVSLTLSANSGGSTRGLSTAPALAPSLAVGAVAPSSIVTSGSPAAFAWGSTWDTVAETLEPCGTSPLAPNEGSSMALAWRSSCAWVAEAPEDIGTPVSPTVLSKERAMGAGAPRPIGKSS